MAMRPEMTLEHLQHRGDGRFPEFVGFRVVDVREGLLHAEIDLQAHHLAPNGFLHAAVVIALADTACGFGCLAHLPDGAINFTTVELKSNFFTSARDGTIVAMARPVHLGRSTQVWDAEVSRKADGKQMALFRCTQLVLWPK